MSRQVIDEIALARAPVEAVWEVIADARGHSRWGPWRETTLDREGEPAPDGVGALRRFVAERRMLFRRVVTIEEVTVFEPPYRLGYRLLSGLPLRDYRGEVTLVGVDEGTRIRWRSEFDGKFPLSGPFFKFALGRFIRDVASRLASASARATMD